MANDQKTPGSKVELIDPSASQEIPVVDINAPIRGSQQLSSQAVPQTDINSPIGLEKITKPSEIPPSNLNAPLKIEKQPQNSSDLDKGNRILILLGGLIVLVILIGIGGFVYLRVQLGL